MLMNALLDEAGPALLRDLRVLVVDDDEALRGLLSIILEEAGCAVETASSVAAARAALLRDPVHLVLTDYTMPGEDGHQLLTFIRKSFPEVPTLVMTGVDDAVLACSLIRDGADDFIRKPFLPQDLTRVLGQILARRERDSRWAQELTGGVLGETINALAAAVEAKDPYTANHSERVTFLALALGRAVGLDGEELCVLEHASRLHDVGKIGVPEAVLHKTTRLDEEEWAAIRRHPVLGAEIIGRVGMFHHVARVVRHHHERFDGAGYPDGLAGEQIPLLSRILTVVDAFDALTSDRAYRPAFDPDEALRILAANAGAQFDARLVDLFTRQQRQLAQLLPELPALA